MQKIGNILYKDELVNHTKIDFINYYYDLQNIDDVNYKIPTLYVGWNFFKGVNEAYKPDFAKDIDVSILEKKIVSNKLYWEFSFNENKAQHIDGIDEFIKNVPYYFFQPKYGYTNLDPVFFSISGISELMSLLPDLIETYYNYKDEMVYLLFENKIVGVDLIMYRYFNFDVDVMKSNFNDKSNKTILDIDGEQYLKYYKIFPNFDDLKRYVVVLLSN